MEDLRRTQLQEARHPAISSDGQFCVAGLTAGTGLRRACCPRTCGRCAGFNCQNLPGGRASCCSSAILQADRDCAHPLDTACVIEACNRSSECTQGKGCAAGRCLRKGQNSAPYPSESDPENGKSCPDEEHVDQSHYYVDHSVNSFLATCGRFVAQHHETLLQITHANRSAWLADVYYQEQLPVILTSATSHQFSVHPYFIGWDDQQAGPLGELVRKRLGHWGKRLRVEKRDDFRIEKSK